MYAVQCSLHNLHTSFNLKFNSVFYFEYDSFYLHKSIMSFQNIILIYPPSYFLLFYHLLYTSLSMVIFEKCKVSQNQPDISLQHNYIILSFWKTISFTYIKRETMNTARKLIYAHIFPHL